MNVHTNNTQLKLYEIYLPYNENTISSSQNSGAKLPYTLKSKERRVEIESDLLLINLPGSKCATKKFQACTPEGKNKCEYPSVAVPRLSDREIVPTNMKQFK